MPRGLIRGRLGRLASEFSTTGLIRVSVRTCLNDVGHPAVGGEGSVVAVQ